VYPIALGYSPQRIMVYHKKQGWNKGVMVKLRGKIKRCSHSSTAEIGSNVSGTDYMRELLENEKSGRLKHSSRGASILNSFRSA
jgi:hypothetical protein